MQTKVQTVEKNQKLSLYDKNTFVRSGYELIGWSYDKTSQEEDYPPSQYISDGFDEDQKLYACWQKHCEVSMIYISGQQNMGTVYGTGIYKYGDTVTIEARPYENYKFLYWNGSSQGISYSFVIKSDVVVCPFFCGFELENCFESNSHIF